MAIEYGSTAEFTDLAPQIFTGPDTIRGATQTVPKQAFSDSIAIHPETIDTGLKQEKPASVFSRTNVIKVEIGTPEATTSVVVQEQDQEPRAHHQTRNNQTDHPDSPQTQAGESGSGIGGTGIEAPPTYGEDPEWNNARAREILEARKPQDLGKLAALYQRLLHDEPHMPTDRIPFTIGEILELLYSDVTPNTVKARSFLPKHTTQALRDDAQVDFNNSMITWRDQFEQNDRFSYPDLIDAKQTLEHISHLNTSRLDADQIGEVDHALQMRMDQHIEKLRRGEGIIDIGEVSSGNLLTGSDVKAQLRSSRYKVTPNAAAILDHQDFQLPAETTSHKFVRVGVSVLPIPTQEPSYNEIVECAHQVGLEPVPEWAALAYLMTYANDKQFRYTFAPTGLAMEPVELHYPSGKVRDKHILTIGGRSLGSRSATDISIQDNLIFIREET